MEGPEEIKKDEGDHRPTKGNFSHTAPRKTKDQDGM